METPKPEILTNPLPPGGSSIPPDRPYGETEEDEDVLDRPVTEVFFRAFRNEFEAKFAEIEKFLDALKQQENAKLRDTALDVPQEIKIGKKKYQLNRLPAGYRVLMINKLQQIADLIPKPEPAPVETLAQILAEWNAAPSSAQDKDKQEPAELANQLLEATQQPGLLAQITGQSQEIFQLICQTIQLAIQAGRGKPDIDPETGAIKNAIIDLETLEWECDGIEEIFTSIIEMNLPIFFTIQSVQRSLMV